MTTTMTTRRAGDRSALARLRLRRLIPLLRRHRLYRAAHVSKRKTSVFFDAARLRRMMLRDRWAAASAYALSFVDDYRHCSHEADELNYRILVLRVLAALAAGQARSVEPLFRRIYACIHFFPEYDRICELLLAMRSDDTKSSRLYGRFKPRAVQGIMDLVAKCPELNKASTRSPRCLSLGHTESWRSISHHKNNGSSLPAHSLALSFLTKRPPQISHRMNSSDAPSTAFVGMLSTSPTPAKMLPVSSTNETGGSNPKRGS
ncbi:hypothetical protein BDA96_08G008800 [Sorghum bicolor]|uniref:Uncharacterized protein n=2 Tax=Sorghum bicolor TaxID=4558 RepID=A0A1B6PAK4_SORBI|nr:uncharacterized protein LOC110429838 isoform X2 [Sorghum bicolor]KAG0519693.1 hypothetical protein BDA96_08G008800 [Sorghum bicolor]KXG22784.1 hypothetical protein SORBI_3008G007800 [Sorghum bicolor]|eukprot:XP_021302189.1 uncharacterized protein LOC110429838 isoform X2 [Sorghum bicolor]